MSARLKRIITWSLSVILVLVGVYYTVKIGTKSYSPEDTVEYRQDELHLKIFYNRPYKKDRDIFGGLVPYGEVWRTGANEATTFETNKDLIVDGSLLPAGIYTLWTIPQKDSWKVIFNSKLYAWGITLDNEASREAEHDVLVLERPVQHLNPEVEQFTISIAEEHELLFLVLAWDQVSLRVPIRLSQSQSREVGHVQSCGSDATVLTRVLLKKSYCQPLRNGTAAMATLHQVKGSM